MTRNLRALVTIQAELGYELAHRSSSVTQPIPPSMHESSSSSDEASPNLSSSPLQTMDGISAALPSSQPNGFSRDSYDSSVGGGEADLPVENDEEVYEGQEDENVALKKYKGSSSLTIFFFLYR
ncbi:uncharacterized protein JCM6883_006495 [Sporobolomyces salmoneus]|uniref:uncharacterized protein n=1 Tax=Sporobolomyces salmoneus TaxID=183962 RepID=UPI00316C7F1D